MPVNLKPPLIVFAGGAVGTALRFGVNELADETWASVTLVNVVGAFALGWFISRSTFTSGSLNAFFATGVLGSFTTFSALALETVLRADEGSWFGAFLFIVLSVLAGLVAAVAGKRVGSPS
jgi:CrcB protein